jgi:hypothetical protein
MFVEIIKKISIKVNIMKFSKATIEKLVPIISVLLSCLLMYNHAHASPAVTELNLATILNQVHLETQCHTNI